MDAVAINTAVAAAFGHTHADTVVTNSRHLNVFTGEIRNDVVIAVKNDRIYYVGERKDELFGSGTIVVDAGGLYALPGFIDAHTHVDSMMTFDAFVPYALRGGTTAVVTECAMIANASGMKAVEAHMNALAGYPVRAYFLAPPMVPPAPALETSAGLTLREFSRLLRRQDVVGVGEAYWNEAVANAGNYFSKAALARSLGKTLEGHSAGARGSRFTAYINCGITSCHESVTMDEALEKLANGMYVMIREGFVRKELDELYRLKDYAGDRSRIILVSDVFDAPMLHEGYLNLLARRAVERGFSPLDAVRMMTINPAVYFGLRDIGAVSPGRYADIQFVEDLRAFSVVNVMAAGRIVVDNATFTADIAPVDIPDCFLTTVTPRIPSAQDFIVRSAKARTVRVMEIASPTIMRETEAVLSSVGGVLKPDAGVDIIPVHVIRRTGKGRPGRGFIKGTGITSGALATTLVWDTCNILVIGPDPHDSVEAVRRLAKIGGGIVIADRGRIMYEFPMPIFGLISRMSVPEIARKQAELETALAAIGCSMKRPFLNIQTIPFTGLPFLRITDKGLVDIRMMKKVGLFKY